MKYDAWILSNVWPFNTSAYAEAVEVWHEYRIPIIISTFTILMIVRTVLHTRLPREKLSITPPPASPTLAAEKKIAPVGTGNKKPISEKVTEKVPRRIVGGVKKLLDNFLEHLQETHNDFRIDTAPLSPLLGYSVFGFGDREGWPTEADGFCSQATDIDKWMAKLTARKRAFPLGMGDPKTDATERLKEWKDGVEDILEHIAETGGLGEGVVGSGDAVESDVEDVDEDDDGEVLFAEQKVAQKKTKSSKKDDMNDMEDLGKTLNKIAAEAEESGEIEIDFTNFSKKAKKPTAAPVIKEMVPKDSPTFNSLTKQGYSIHPDQLATLKHVTQLYVSIDASNRESLRKIDRPLHRDFWERFNACLDILKKRRFEQRTVFRLTLVKGFNIDDEVEGYAALVEQGLPCFVEIKGVTYCGTSSSASAGLTMQNVPFYSEIQEFVLALTAALQKRGLGYGIAAEHAHSCCVLIASDRFKNERGKWCTRIDYQRFFELLEGGGEFRPEDYMGEETPDWAQWGNGGFDPRDERVYRKGKNKVPLAVKAEEEEGGE
ncbi:putative tRNA wybutosine-synthesizing protein 1 [Glarea lozoyensis 74030]|uniref:Putative tRNA wybutosine-synthesizing protein 1 n=1 Tax=Glarea lozoyensis (strain ATCC 74030 / MF5533) TaxID=1104152 RepID=H0ERX6_GLAL7|nr:putative tRNA wybutosine-synthesizing protein 1 [Glarea lozoyensis 74030]